MGFLHFLSLRAESSWGSVQSVGFGIRHTWILALVLPLAGNDVGRSFNLCRLQFIWIMGIIIFLAHWMLLRNEYENSCRTKLSYYYF